jgi:transposase
MAVGMCRASLTSTSSCCARRWRRPDKTIPALRDHLAGRAGGSVSAPTVGRALSRLGLSRKKKVAASERNNYKRGWFWCRAAGFSRRRLVFLDESAVNTAMTLLYGRAPRGERVHDSVPRSYGEQTSLIRCALVRARAHRGDDADGRGRYLGLRRLPRAGARPRLRKGDVVVLDNLNVHKASQVEEVAAARGARVLWLAPYSPDFSPIEQCWSKIKTLLRAAKARTREEPEKALAQAIKLITKSDIRGWFKHCGYKVASV